MGKKSYKQLRADSVHSSIDADEEVASPHSVQANVLSPLDLDADDVPRGEYGNAVVFTFTNKCCDVVGEAWKLPIGVFNFFRAHPLTFVELLTWFIYYIVGIIFYSSVEGWNALECVYFITVSFSTIGYGQYAPTTERSRLFTTFYCVFGIACVLTAINRVATRWLIRAQKPTLDFFLGRKQHLPSTKIVFSCVVIFLLVFIGMLFFSALEGWSYSDSFYWTITTMTTVGYGGLDVKNETTLTFGVAFIYSCLLMYSLALQNIDQSFQVMKVQNRRTAALEGIRRSGIFNSRRSSTTMAQFLSEGDCSEFVLHCLLKMEKVLLQEDLEPIVNFYMQEKDNLLKRSDMVDDYLARLEAEEEAEQDELDRTRKGNLELDAEAVVSDETRNKMLNEGVDRFVSIKKQRDLVQESRFTSNRLAANKSMPPEHDESAEKEDDMEEDDMEEVDLEQSGGAEPETMISPLQEGN